MAAYYPPVSDAELQDARAYENVFDRVVVSQTGVWARQRAGNWIELRPLLQAPVQQSPQWPAPRDVQITGVQFNTTENKAAPVFKPGDRVVHHDHPNTVLLVEDFHKSTETGADTVKLVGHPGVQMASHFRIVDQG